MMIFRLEKVLLLQRIKSVIIVLNVLYSVEVKKYNQDLINIGIFKERNDEHTTLIWNVVKSVFI